jgi:hypothetical protein
LGVAIATGAVRSWVFRPAITVALDGYHGGVCAVSARRELMLGAARHSRARRLARPMRAASERDLHATDPFLGSARVRGAHGAQEAVKRVS